MSLNHKLIGAAFTGSFCTYAAAFPQIQALLDAGAQVQTIFSPNAQTISSRFGAGPDFLRQAEELTGLPPITTIEDAEPIGPSGKLDLLLIMPCTGNTMAKLANGITDTAVLMAAKAHLRNEKPLLLSIATNDALSMNLKNIGLLMNCKNIFFVPFGQDNPAKKPHSMIAHTNLVVPAAEAALEKRQYQPVVISPF
ncbi:MAG: dipicolinate synthase subunit B [Lachnospiraceae bacterium]